MYQCIKTFDRPSKRRRQISSYFKVSCYYTSWRGIPSRVPPTRLLFSIAREETATRSAAVLQCCSCKQAPTVFGCNRVWSGVLDRVQWFNAFRAYSCCTHLSETIYHINSWGTTVQYWCRLQAVVCYFTASSAKRVNINLRAAQTQRRLHRIAGPPVGQSVCALQFRGEDYS